MAVTPQHKRVIRKPTGQSKKPNKYGAEAVFYDPVNQTISAHRINERDIFFASRLELRVWLKLRSLLDLRQIAHQSPLRIKNDTANYPAMYWRCDFRVWKLHEPHIFLNIEAKGIVLPEFRAMLPHLEYHSPGNWAKLVVVSDREKRIDCQITTVLVERIPQILEAHKII